MWIIWHAVHYSVPSGSLIIQRYKPQILVSSLEHPTTTPEILNIVAIGLWRPHMKTFAPFILTTKYEIMHRCWILLLLMDLHTAWMVQMLH